MDDDFFEADPPTPAELKLAFDVDMGEALLIQASRGDYPAWAVGSAAVKLQKLAKSSRLAIDSRQSDRLHAAIDAAESAACKLNLDPVVHQWGFQILRRFVDDLHTEPRPISHDAERADWFRLFRNALHDADLRLKIEERAAEAGAPSPFANEPTPFIDDTASGYVRKISALFSAVAEGGDPTGDAAKACRLLLGLLIYANNSKVGSAEIGAARRLVHKATKILTAATSAHIDDDEVRLSLEAVVELLEALAIAPELKALVDPQSMNGERVGHVALLVSRLEGIAAERTIQAYGDRLRARADERRRVVH